MTFTKRRTITSHRDYARFLAECGEDDLRHIKRQDSIPSPFAYSPVWNVMEWQGVPIIIREVSHKRYVVFQVNDPEYVRAERGMS